MKTLEGCSKSKMYIDALIVVEGNSDKSRLSSLFEADIDVTNGLVSCKVDIDFVKEVSKRRDVVIFTDPDRAGEEIRRRLNAALEKAINLYVPKDAKFNGKKHGVAECDKDTLLTLFKPYISSNKCKNNGLLMEDLYNLGIIGTNESSAIRGDICAHYSLGKCNAKTLLNRLNILQISKEELKDYLSNGNK